MQVMLQITPAVQCEWRRRRQQQPFAHAVLANLSKKRERTGNRNQQPGEKVNKSALWGRTASCTYIVSMNVYPHFYSFPSDDDDVGPRISFSECES
jgi:hypothetical protein